MRFSLLTLLFLALWCATIGLFWHRSHPWELSSFPKGEINLSSKELLANYPDWAHDLGRDITPDQSRRQWRKSYESSVFLLCDKRTDITLCTLPMNFGFVDDNHIVCVDFFDNHFKGGRHYFMRRRHPEWWWGHFYRPEVWALLALTLAISWRCIKALRNRHPPTSASPTAYPQTPEIPPSPPAASRASPAG